MEETASKKKKDPNCTNKHKIPNIRRFLPFYEAPRTNKISVKISQRIFPYHLFGY